MLRLVIVATAVTSAAQALRGGASSKASLLRKKAATVVNKRELASCSGSLDWNCVDGTTCRMANRDAQGYEQVICPCGRARADILCIDASNVSIKLAFLD